MTVGKFTKRAHVNDQTVRYYERRGLMAVDSCQLNEPTGECPVLEILNEDNIDNA